MVYNSNDYKTDIDYDLLMKNSTDDELKNYIQSNFLVPGRLKKPFDNVFKFLKIICKMSNIQPSNEQLVYILTNHRRVLCEACAGAGKTTMSYFRMIIFNAYYNIDSSCMLGLCYNKHAADSFDLGYSKIVKSINLALGSSGRIGSRIKAYTIHAWCKLWVEEYKDRWKYTVFSILDEADQQKIITNELNRYNNKLQKQIIITDTVISSMVQLYNYAVETLTLNNPDAWYGLFSNLHMFTKQDLVQIMSNVSKYKKLMKKLDFGDLLNHMYELVCDPVVIERIRKNYKFIMVDEWQDVTPAMSRIIEVIMQGSVEHNIPPFEDGYLTVIGDGDQAIYSFRGTDSDNCIKFRYNYGTNGLSDEVKITSMSINRRCKSEILDKARAVITSLSKRIQKPVNYLTVGGNVDIKTYNSEQQQVQEIISIVKKYQDEYYNTCICYRSMFSSSYISMELLRQNIPFNVARGIQPFEDLYTSTLNDILNLLANPTIPDYALKVLYKLLPKNKFFNKESIAKDIKEYMELKKTSNRYNYIEDKEFWKHPFETGKTQKGFDEAIYLLKSASECCRSGKFLKSFMPSMITLLKRYYLDSMLNGVFKGRLSEEYMHYVEEYYCCTKTYNDFKSQMISQRDFIKDNKSNGIYLTTMHGLKGLEFNNVIIMDLEDGKFPGVDLREEGMTVEQLEEAENEARRLFYVALTRAKNNLHLIFHRNRPTRYIRYFTDNDKLATIYNANKDNNYTPTDNNYIHNNNYDNPALNFNNDFVFMDNVHISNGPNFDIQPNDSEYKMSSESMVKTESSNQDDMEIDELNIEINDTDLDLEDIDIDTAGLDDVDISMDNSDLDVSTSSTDLFSDSSQNKDNSTSAMVDTSTPYDNLRESKPRLTSILDILRDKYN